MKVEVIYKPTQIWVHTWISPTRLHTVVYSREYKYEG